MQFLEKDLEQIIYETDFDLLREAGLYLSGIKKRQLKIGNYGRADLVLFDRSRMWQGYRVDNIKITVVECKQNELSADSFWQALGYLRGIKHYISKRGLFTGLDVDYKIVLIGKSICLKGSFCYLPEFFDVEFYTYSYEFDGIKFNDQSGFVMNNTGFNI